MSQTPKVLLDEVKKEAQQLAKLWLENKSDSRATVLRRVKKDSLLAIYLSEYLKSAQNSDSEVFLKELLDMLVADKDYKISFDHTGKPKFDYK